MSAVEFDRVCEALPQLTPSQLEQVRLRLGFLVPDEPAAQPARAGDDHDWLLRGLEAELRRRGVLGRGRVQADRIVPTWRKVSAAVRDDLVRALAPLNSGVGGRPDVRKLDALGALVARTLADYLAGGGVPVGPKTLLANAGKALVALDAQFPGYAEAGLLGCCLDPRLVGVA